MELNKENLHREYIINNKTQKECSEIFGCSEWKIIRYAKEYGLKKVKGVSYNISTDEFKNRVKRNLGEDYECLNLGLKYIKTQPSFKNYWKNTKQVKNREPKRHKEIVTLYKTGEVIPIYNAGTKVYVWDKSQN